MVNGVIVLDPPAQIPDGTRVEVIPTAPKPQGADDEPTLAFMLKYAGTAKDLPPDFAAQHDHYIHGTPKK